jgi:hypothetical protein
VLIIDSLSHAWAGEGGILDMHDKAAAASKTGNSFTAWREVTPQHNALVETILGARPHVIVTMRTKTAYDLVDDGNGKKKPIKVGLAPVQRDGLEYEFTVVVDVSVEGHVATATKDRTRLFDGKHWVPTPETGEALRQWLEAGKDPDEASRELLANLKARVDAIDDVPGLNDWWREHSSGIVLLTPSDQEALKAHCAARKTALLGVQEKRQGPRRAAAGGPSIPQGGAADQTT